MKTNCKLVDHEEKRELTFLYVWLALLHLYEPKHGASWTPQRARHIKHFATDQTFLLQFAPEKQIRSLFTDTQRLNTISSFQQGIINNSQAETVSENTRDWTEEILNIRIDMRQHVRSR